jgi:acyl-CoA reductase-like NAD-dependent aldehyde dehydrogenase
MLFKWDSLIKENREDIATILVYETGKPRSEAYGEIDYSTGFTWWFAGEAERIHARASKSTHLHDQAAARCCCSIGAMELSYCHDLEKGWCCTGCGLYHGRQA